MSVSMNEQVRTLHQRITKQISKHIGAGVSFQYYLICRGKCLQDDLTLRDYNLRNNDTIYVNGVLLGGGCGSSVMVDEEDLTGDDRIDFYNACYNCECDIIQAILSLHKDDKMLMDLILKYQDHLVGTSRSIAVYYSVLCLLLLVCQCYHQCVEINICIFFL